MLERLYVNNFALIDELEVEFGKGLNVLSGETGAGKSIIIGSLNFVLGGKADKDIIKTGCEMTEVSALMSVENEDVIKKLEELDALSEDDDCILIKRSFSINGKSVCRINGKPATVSMLREISSLLVDIHGQHDHQSLLNPSSHIVMLDRLCSEQLSPELEKLRALYTQYKEVSSKLREIDTSDKDIQYKLDLFIYQRDEIDEASLKAGEDEELADRRNILMNSVKLRKLVNETIDCLSRGDRSAADNIGIAIKNFETIAEIDETQNDTLEALNDAYSIIDDAAKEIRAYGEGIDSDPDELDDVEERLQLIYELKNKYGKTIEDILSYRDKIDEKINLIENSEELAKEYTQKKNKLEKEIRTVCAEITKIRKNTAQETEKKIISILNDLSMTDAQFIINITPKEGFDENGSDKVEFLISANKGEEPRPLSKIASGGEMSRVMLALKNILADVDNIDTFIFDEIDTGISGRTAQKTAENMLAVSKKHQIICITHLPQIASMADKNFLIEKSSDNERTNTNIVELYGEKVYNELARLIGGAEITKATLEAAREMKLMANKLKES